MELQRQECLPTGISEEESQELLLVVKELTSTLARLATWWKQHT